MMYCKNRMLVAATNGSLRGVRVIEETGFPLPVLIFSLKNEKIKTATPKKKTERSKVLEIRG